MAIVNTPSDPPTYAVGIVPSTFVYGSPALFSSSPSSSSSCSSSSSSTSTPMSQGVLTAPRLSGVSDGARKLSPVSYLHRGSPSPVSLAVSSESATMATECGSSPAALHADERGAVAKTPVRDAGGAASVPSGSASLKGGDMSPPLRGTCGLTTSSASASREAAQFLCVAATPHGSSLRVGRQRENGEALRTAGSVGEQPSPPSSFSASLPQTRTLETVPLASVEEAAEPVLQRADETLASRSLHVVFQRRVLSAQQVPLRCLDGNAFCAWVGATRSSRSREVVSPAGRATAQAAVSSRRTLPSAPAVVQVLPTPQTQRLALAAANAVSGDGTRRQAASRPARPQPGLATSSAYIRATTCPAVDRREDDASPRAGGPRLGTSVGSESSRVCQESRRRQQGSREACGGDAKGPVVELRTGGHPKTTRRLHVEKEEDIAAKLKEHVVTNVPGRVAVWVRQGWHSALPPVATSSTTAIARQMWAQRQAPSYVVTYVLRYLPEEALHTVVIDNRQFILASTARPSKQNVPRQQHLSPARFTPHLSGAHAPRHLNCLSSSGRLPACRPASPVPRRESPAPPSLPTRAETVGSGAPEGRQRSPQVPVSGLGSAAGLVFYQPEKTPRPWGVGYWRPLVSCCFENTATPRFTSLAVPPPAPQPGARSHLAVSLSRAVAGPDWESREEKAHSQRQELREAKIENGKAEETSAVSVDHAEDARPSAAGQKVPVRRCVSVGVNTSPHAGSLLFGPESQRRRSSDTFCPTHLFEPSSGRSTEWEPPFLDSRLMTPECASARGMLPHIVEYFFLDARAAARRGGSDKETHTRVPEAEARSSGDRRSGRVSLGLGASADGDVASRGSSLSSLSHRGESRESEGDLSDRLREPVSGTPRSGRRGLYRSLSHTAAFVECRRATCEIYALEDEVQSDGASPALEGAARHRAAPGGPRRARGASFLPHAESLPEAALHPTLPPKDNAMAEWLLMSGASLAGLDLRHLGCAPRTLSDDARGDLHRETKGNSQDAQERLAEEARAADAEKTPEGREARGERTRVPKARKSVPPSPPPSARLFAAQSEGARRNLAASLVRRVSSEGSHQGVREQGDCSGRVASEAQEPEETESPRQGTTRVKELAKKWDRGASRQVSRRSSSSIPSPRHRGHERFGSVSPDYDDGVAVYARFGSVAERYLQNLKRPSSVSSAEESLSIAAFPGFARRVPEPPRGEGLWRDASGQGRLHGAESGGGGNGVSALASWEKMCEKEAAEPHKEASEAGARH
ncbi:hypothetical protein TGARI_239400 [Toxoplasma gondii ARI]|uniref:Uncharacterized protein n=1 Tax=Toxoplasma gondii ARI TaxID=1074872 RepID=A0A139XMN1_TOXGO|nr:hypothetical protein TGARI_239400 [Toxoplasma gondii ARI]